MQISYWRMFVAGVAIEYAVCLAVSFYWNDQDRYWYAFLIMLGLWAVQAIVGLKNFAVTTIYYHLFGKSQLAKFFEERMVDAEMPYYGDHYDFYSDYLRDVLRDQNATREQIIFSAETMGVMDALKGQSLLRGWRIMKVSNLAMEKYFKRRTVQERRRQDHGWLE